MAFYRLARFKDILFLFAASGALTCGAAEARVAPGPLSKAHTDLGGLLNCTSCHDLLGRGLKCLECHVEIKSRIDARTGYHSRTFKSSGGDCAQCHPEHGGRESILIHLDRKNFDHGIETGFALEGEHRKQKCEKCHTASRIPSSARSGIKMKDLNRSFLGLSRECIACHQEPHQNQLGTDCLRCHNQVAWNPPSKFSHSCTSFPLTGLHRGVSCGKCHDPARAAQDSEAPGQNASAKTGSDQKTLLFKRLSFRSCENCHLGPHSDAFRKEKTGGRCDGCHKTSGWKSRNPAGNFDHGVTGFRLVGRHTVLECDECHQDADFGCPVAHELCRNCHEDRHGGQFDSRSAGADCSACHTPAGFKPSLFARDDHMRTGFPLEGKHSTLPCAKCHRPEGQETLYKIGKSSCARCHMDPHGGEFASEPYNNRCNLCHTQAGFEVTTFTRERHAMTEFPLTGRHAEVACRDCHKRRPTPPGITAGISKAVSVSYVAEGGMGPASEVRSRYRFASHDCDVCHSDPHGFNPGKNLPCRTCHIPQRWDARLPFDHSRTGFRLEGSHLDAAHPIDCIQCHKASEQARGAGDQAVPVFAGTSPRCSACHSEKDAHGGQFGNPEGRPTDCSSCHTPEVWSAGIFDHDSSSFILSGAHLSVACTSCHEQAQEINGRLVRVYRGTPTECLGCH